MEKISSPPPLPPTGSTTGKFTPRHQKYTGLILVILGLVLCGIGVMTDVSSIVVWAGWLFSGTGLAFYAKGGGRSFGWGLFVGLGIPFLAPLIGLLVFARNMKDAPKTGKRASERSLRYVAISALIWALLDAFFFDSGAISLILCVAGALYFLPHAFWARKDAKLFKLRLSKAAVTFVAGVATLGIILYGNVVAEERAELIVAAVEQFQTKYGRYPDKLEEIVPEYIPAIPQAKFALGAEAFGAERFRYSVTDSQHMLVYTVTPPFGRRIYTFEAHKWSTLD
ncbi:MAG: hypothetical protein Q7T25_03310 [Sideroxyarcus sp.]|nr:hypothetical protein [Sideroxyarcus sp.]